jgi:hypothetical protein
MPRACVCNWYKRSAIEEAKKKKAGDAIKLDGVFDDGLSI